MIMFMPVGVPPRVGGFPDRKNRGSPHRQPAPAALLICRSIGAEIRLEEGGGSMKGTIQQRYRALRSRKGQSLVEYSLVLALIAIVAITVLRGLGRHVNNTLSSINANLP